MEYIDYLDILQRIKKMRVNLNLTQEKMASDLNITVKHLSAIERGVSLPSFQLFIKIINYFNSINGNCIDMNKIFYGENKNEITRRKTTR